MRKITTLVFATVLLFISTAVWGQTTDLLISEYAEGTSGNSKYIELYNGTGAAVDLSKYKIWTIANGGSWPESQLALTGTLENGSTYVIANNATDVPGADLYNGICVWNGDDAVGLAKDISGTFTLIDAVGTDGADPGDGWSVAGTANATKDKKLTRKPSVCSPTTSWTTSAGTSESDSQWIIGTYTTGAAGSGHTANCSTLPSLNTPTFSVNSGNYFSTQSVTISNETAGTQIYYTTDGLTPTENSTLYSSPISITTTTTLKAKAFKAGMVASSVASATYTFPTEVANIAALRALTLPAFAKLTGEAVLTLKSATRNTKYIQDATAAVLIDDPNGVITTSYNLGDGITGIIGTLATFNSMLQFTPVTNPGTASSTSNIVTPTVVALDELTNHQAKLVQVKGIAIAATGNFAASTSYSITGSTSAVIRTQYPELNYINTTIPQTSQDITGVVLIYNSNLQLIPRSITDFAIATSTINPTTNAGIYVVDGKIALKAEAGQLVEVYNAVGQRVAAVRAVEGLNTIGVKAKGVVVVRTAGKLAKVIL